MQFAKFFVVSIVLFEKLCLSKIIIKSASKPNGFQELEDASINLITTCEADKDKAIVLCGDFPVNFIKRLSSHFVYSLIFFDETRRYDGRYKYKNYSKNLQKVTKVVAMASSPSDMQNVIMPMIDSRYYTGTASFLILGWSPENKHAGCYETKPLVEILIEANAYGTINTNLICKDRKHGILIFTANPYKNEAPSPWLLNTYGPLTTGRMFYIFVRPYLKTHQKCKNLFFDKTNDMNGWKISTLHTCTFPYCLNENKEFYLGKRDRLESNMFTSFIKRFFISINATERKQWKALGTRSSYNQFRLMINPVHLRGMVFGTSHSYPFGPIDKFLISQYRGNKSQLQKLLSVIDRYSWLGIFFVYIVTLMFFKYFLSQNLIVGFLNIVRLTCNFGITGLPTNLASQIYLACLLFFVVTMQGIFTGNLASLLTHHSPVRQINSIRDLIDFEYNVSVGELDVIHFEDRAFKNRLIVRPATGRQECVLAVKANSSLACLTWSGRSMQAAINAGLYIGTDRIAYEYIVTPIPYRWVLENRFNTFLGISISNGIMMDFKEMVEYVRFVEFEAEQEFEKPEVIILQNVHFAFMLLAIGLVCAFICFGIEIIFYRLQRKITKTRVIVLKKR